MPTHETTELTATFDDLQRRLTPLWDTIGLPTLAESTQEPNTVVVVPSMTVDKEFPGASQQAYEERMLFMLFLLRQPRVRLIYVTSQAIQPNIVEYYLQLLPGVVASSARKRLFLVSPVDASPRPLSRKLLERPRLIAHIRTLIPDLH
ncbi:MAG: carboxylate-amine ligase, partial [Chloroflexi bacterium]|nr:carboxylate-amine ligase [Chloroflexota bacterium]